MGAKKQGRIERNWNKKQKKLINILQKFCDVREVRAKLAEAELEYYQKTGKIYEEEDEEWICHDCKNLKNENNISDYYTCGKGCGGEVPEVPKCEEFEAL